MLGLESEEYQDLILSIGTHRGSRRLSPLEVARLLEKAIKSGATRRDCAKALQVGTTQISAFLKLVALAPEIQYLSGWRGSKSASIAFSTMAELARLPHDDQIKAAESVLRHGLTWKEVVQLVQISSRSAQPIETCIDSVLKLRPQIQTRHLFVGAITCASLIGDLEGLSQRRRDELISKALSRTLGNGYQVEGNLGAGNFTILSNHDLPQLLGLSPDELEQNVNANLETLRSST